MNTKYVEKLSAQLAQNNMDALLIGPSEDMAYITDFVPHQDERFQGLFVLKDGSCFYIAPKLNQEEIEHFLGKNTTVYAWDDRDGFVETLRYAFKAHGLQGKEKRIGVNSGIRAADLLDAAPFFKGQFFNGISTVEESRVIKTSEEIKNLQIAAKMADEVMEALTTFIRPGITEAAIRHHIQLLFEKKGSHGLAFTPIVASGPNSSKPHYNQYSRTLTERDIVILDFGCKYQNACSDISRTFFIGTPSEEEKQVYEIVLQSNRAGVQAVKESVTAEMIDHQARQVIAQAGYGDFFFKQSRSWNWI